MPPASKRQLSWARPATRPSLPPVKEEPAATPAPWTTRKMRRSGLAAGSGTEDFRVTQARRIETEAAEAARGLEMEEEA